MQGCRDHFFLFFSSFFKNPLYIGFHSELFSPQQNVLLAHSNTLGIACNSIMARRRELINHSVEADIKLSLCICQSVVLGDPMETRHTYSLKYFATF